MRGNSNNLKKFFAIVFVTIIVIFLIYLKAIIKVNFKFCNYHILKRFILSYGKLSVLIYILIYSLKPLALVIPASLLSVISGALYGPIYGTMYSMIGVFISSSLAFFVARILGKEAVDKIVKGKIAKLDDDIEKKGLIVMLILRLSVVFPLDPLSYAAGLTKIKYRDFIIGTIVGTLPEVFIYNYFGTNIQKPFNKYNIFSILFIVILILISFIVQSKRKNRMN
ncbi:TVP38/TMEM64 family protein [Caloramator sp. E03]|uniref:TVP38/TMEM64 family protein n=1 Tax=Caloramator sp. E03 TaxID=2576307 RepID=UPI001110B9D6|nr:TVP38/TMEM64 family protein [Caloramator sp. E03]QCX34622.1 TVP38/TMEM64 family protein [Caloramator sp. E03]